MIEALTHVPPRETTHRPVEIQWLGNVPFPGFSEEVIAEICRHGADPFRPLYQISSAEGETKGVIPLSFEDAVSKLEQLSLKREIGEIILKGMSSNPFTFFGATIKGEPFCFVFERPPLLQRSDETYRFMVAECESER